MRAIDFMLVVITTICLTANQVFLKIWLGKYATQILPIIFNKLGLLFRYDLMISVIAFVAAISIWLYLLQRVDFGLLYPMVSLSYVFGLLAAEFVFSETVPTTRWIGVLVILLGVFLITREA